MANSENTENKRAHRTTEERIAEVDTKIEELNKQIQNIEEKKQEAVTAYNDRIAKVMDRIKGLGKTESCYSGSQASSQAEKDQKTEDPGSDEAGAKGRPKAGGNC